MKALLVQLLKTLQHASPHEGNWQVFQSQTRSTEALTLYFSALKELSFFYFQHRTRSTPKQTLGIGSRHCQCADTRKKWIAITEHRIEEFQQQEISLPAFSSLGFDEHVGQQWAGFPFAVDWIPDLLLEQQGDRLIGSITLDSHTEQQFIENQQKSLTLLEELISNLPLSSETMHPCSSSTPLISQAVTPHFQDWTKSIDAAQNLINEERFDKVVLARQEDWHFSSPIDSQQLFHQWRVKEPNTSHFFIQWAPHQQFFGCTPETLFHREHNHLSTEALAGTCPRSEHPEQDQWLGQKLLHDKKNLSENQTVARYICHQLQKFSLGAVTCEPLELKKLQRVQHLKRAIQVHLKTDAQSTALLNVLHPTPAVAGTPLNRALAFINKNEGFPRGWYTGAIGLISPTTAHYSVALRCARLDKNTISLYSGAGIMPQSQALSEYKELDNKTEMVKSLLRQMTSDYKENLAES